MSHKADNPPDWDDDIPINVYGEEESKQSRFNRMRRLLEKLDPSVANIDPDGNEQ